MSSSRRLVRQLIHIESRWTQQTLLASRGNAHPSDWNVVSSSPGYQVIRRGFATDSSIRGFGSHQRRGRDADTRGWKLERNGFRRYVSALVRRRIGDRYSESPPTATVSAPPVTDPAAGSRQLPSQPASFLIRVAHITTSDPHLVSPIWLLHSPSSTHSPLLLCSTLYSFTGARGPTASSYRPIVLTPRQSHPSNPFKILLRSRQTCP